jgi:hypothetical protein
MKHEEPRLNTRGVYQGVPAKPWPHPFRQQAHITANQWVTALWEAKDEVLGE